MSPKGALENCPFQQGERSEKTELNEKHSPHCCRLIQSVKK